MMFELNWSTTREEDSTALGALKGEAGPILKGILARYLARFSVRLRLVAGYELTGYFKLSETGSDTCTSF